EDYARKEISLPDHCFVQMGDFSGYTIQQCAKKSIKTAHVAGFVGKLTKIAMGIKQTHVKGSKVDMDFLADLAKDCNANNKTIDEIKKANTARHVQEIIIENKIDGFFVALCKMAYDQMRMHSENKVELKVILFDFDGSILGRYP
ncbi:MAG: cobalt-precorrin-5B (C(1))-methyltransferase, partial [Nitrosopumilaceae archaeon]|nr:cobalt-precorrin-5B (C(1))-methyltransferase [Nitrosopumilaceae archaeon]NDF27351.1 cobalt-precorrin-5B (C(1))-methyltransferase [Nitrosopumilaceae archaeon]